MGAGGPHLRPRFARDRDGCVAGVGGGGSHYGGTSPSSPVCLAGRGISILSVPACRPAVPSITDRVSPGFDPFADMGVTVERGLAAMVLFYPEGTSRGAILQRLASRFLQRVIAASPAAQPHSQSRHLHARNPPSLRTGLRAARPADRRIVNFDYRQLCRAHFFRHTCLVVSALRTFFWPRCIFWLPWGPLFKAASNIRYNTNDCGHCQKNFKRDRKCPFLRASHCS